MWLDGCYKISMWNSTPKGKQLPSNHRYNFLWNFDQLLNNEKRCLHNKTLDLNQPKVDQMHHILHNKFSFVVREIKLIKILTLALRNCCEKKIVIRNWRTKREENWFRSRMIQCSRWVREWIVSFEIILVCYLKLFCSVISQTFLKKFKCWHFVFGSWSQWAFHSFRFLLEANQEIQLRKNNFDPLGSKSSK